MNNSFRTNSVPAERLGSLGVPAEPEPAL